MLDSPLIEFQLSQLHLVWGKYAGSVSDNQDPEQMGRLKVRCPAILGDAEVWARPCVPYAGKGVGMYFIPPQDAGVWVEFEGGNPSRAIWSGCYWAKGDLPDDATSPDIKLIVTDTATLKIDDSKGTIELSNDAEAKTTWDKAIVSEAGQAKHTVSSTGVTSESAAGSGKVEVTDGGVSVNGGAFQVV